MEQFLLNERKKDRKVCAAVLNEINLEARSSCLKNSLWVWKCNVYFKFIKVYNGATMLSAIYHADTLN